MNKNSSWFIKNNLPTPEDLRTSINNFEYIDDTINQNKFDFKDILKEAFAEAEAYKAGHNYDSWFILSISNTDKKITKNRIDLGLKFLILLANHYIGLASTANYDCVSRVLLYCIKDCFLSKNISNASFNSYLNVCENIGVGCKDPNIKIYIMALEVIMYEEFFQNHTDYSPVSNTFFSERVYKKIYSDLLFVDESAKIALVQDTHNQLWEADVAAQKFLETRPLLVSRYTNTLSKKLNRRLADIIFKADKNKNLITARGLKHSVLWKVLIKNSKGEQCSSDIYDLIKDAHIPLAELLLYICISAGRVKMGQEKLLLEINKKTEDNTLRGKNYIEAFSKTRASYLLPALSNLGQAIVTTIIKDIFKLKKISEADYFACISEIQDNNNGYLLLQQLFAQIGQWVWVQFSTSQEYHNLSVSKNMESTQLHLFYVKKGYEALYDFSPIMELVKEKNFWRDLIIESTSVSFPRSMPQQAKLITTPKSNQNTMINSESVLKDVPSGLTINLQLIDEFFAVFSKGYSVSIDKQLIDYLFAHPKVTDVANKKGSITRRDLHKFVSFVVFVKHMTLIVPEAVSPSKLTLCLFESKGMDFRGRLYSSTVASVTASEFYRILFTSGEGCVDIKFVIAVLLRSLQSTNKKLSILELYELYKTDSTVLPTPPEVAEKGLLKDYRLIWQYAYQYSVYKALKNNPKQHTPFSLEIDCTSSVFQYIGAIMHDSEIGTLTNAIGPSPLLDTTIDSFIRFKPNDFYETILEIHKKQFPQIHEILPGLLNRKFFKNYLMTKSYSKSDRSLLIENIIESLWLYSPRKASNEVVTKKHPSKTDPEIVERPPFISKLSARIGVLLSKGRIFQNAFYVDTNFTFDKTWKDLIVPEILEKKREKIDNVFVTHVAKIIQKSINILYQNSLLKTAVEYSELISLLKYRYAKDGTISWKYNLKDDDIEIRMRYLKTTKLILDAKKLTPVLPIKNEVGKVIETGSSRSQLTLKSSINEVDSKAQLRAIVPNFTHSLDSMLLHKTYYKWLWGVKTTPLEKKEFIENIIPYLYSHNFSTIHDCFIVHPGDLEKLLGYIRSSFADVVYSATNYLHQVLIALDEDVDAVLLFDKTKNPFVINDIPLSHFIALCSDVLSKTDVIIDDLNSMSKISFKLIKSLDFGSHFMTSPPVQSAIQNNIQLKQTYEYLLSMDPVLFSRCMSRLFIYKDSTLKSLKADSKLVVGYIKLFESKKRTYDDYSSRCGWVVSLK